MPVLPAWMHLRAIAGCRFEGRKGGGVRDCGKRSRGVDDVRALYGRDVGFRMSDFGPRRLLGLFARLLAPGLLESLKFPGVAAIGLDLFECSHFFWTINANLDAE